MKLLAISLGEKYGTQRLRIEGKREVSKRGRHKNHGSFSCLPHLLRHTYSLLTISC